MSVQSVHLAKVPNISHIIYNQEIIFEMELVRRICSAISSIRKKHNIKARLPLQQVKIIGNNLELSEYLIEIIKDESNLKNVSISNSFEGLNVQTNINLDAKKVAKRIGKDFQTVLKKAKSGIFEKVQGGIQIEGHTIYENEYSTQLKIDSAVENYTSIDGRYLIVLDTNITLDLEKEGIARDFIRMVQKARKDEGFNISDNITLKVNFKKSSSLFQEAIKENEKYISSQVLAQALLLVDKPLKYPFYDDITFEISL